jgi:hypothetical protein
LRFRSFVCLALALRGDVAVAQSAHVTRENVGDTTVVVTTGDGVWGPIRDAVEVMRIHATTKESTFGQVMVLTAMPDGGVVLFDYKSVHGPLVRQFDADGKFVRNLGKHGGGRGQYALSDPIPNIGLTARRDGSVVMKEGSRAVLDFGADGKYRRGFMLRLANGGTWEIVAGDDGTYLVRAPSPPIRPGARAVPPHERAMNRYDSAGRKLASLAIPPRWSPLYPDVYESWMPMPDGRVLVVRSDKVGFLLSDPAKRTDPMAGELLALPVPYVDEEAAERRAYEEFLAANQSQYVAKRITDVKPLAVARGIVDVDGRIWIHRAGPGQKVAAHRLAMIRGNTFTAYWQNQVIAVCFRPDGTLLGELRFPPGVNPSYVGDFAWSMIREPDGTQSLVKYRIANF